MRFPSPRIVLFSQRLPLSPHQARNNPGTLCNTSSQCLPPNQSKVSFSHPLLHHHNPLRRDVHCVERIRFRCSVSCRPWGVHHLDQSRLSRHSKTLTSPFLTRSPPAISSHGLEPQSLFQQSLSKSRGFTCALTWSHFTSSQAALAQSLPRRVHGARPRVT